MLIGYYLVQGDKTTCGGTIVEGDIMHQRFGRPIARERDKVTCGMFPGMFYIVGGVENDQGNGRKKAGTLDSISTCPCHARFLPSLMNDFYEKLTVVSGANLQPILHPTDSIFAPQNSSSQWTDEQSPLAPVEDDSEFLMRFAGAIISGNQYELMDTSEPPELAEIVRSPSPQVIIPPEEPAQQTITDADREPYKKLEEQYPDLFSNQYIQRLSEESSTQFNSVEDVDMDETKVINATQEHKVLGTQGLGPCIAICAYGKTVNNELILGLHHYSGIANAKDIFEDIEDDMLDEGARDIEFYVVGSMVIPGGENAQTLKVEKKILALKDEFNIKGARLHVSEGLLEETDVEGPQENRSVDVVMTADKIYFRHKPMYR